MTPTVTTELQNVCIYLIHVSGYVLITDAVTYPLMLVKFVNRENGTWCEQGEMAFTSRHTEKHIRGGRLHRWPRTRGR